MVCITGDTHGDLTRMNHKRIRRLKKKDALIICGDFGFIWQGGAKENSILKSLGKKRCHILFVEGCHENYDLLGQYPEEEWNGGVVRVISGNVRMLERGYVYQIDGKSFFTFGGGQSDDMDLRREAGTWWPQEQPSQEELDRARENLEQNGNQVDYIISHEPPASLLEFLQIRLPEQITELTAYFDQIRSNCRFRTWFFGKCHLNKVIPPQFHAVFDDVIEIE